MGCPLGRALSQSTVIRLDRSGAMGAVLAVGRRTSRRDAGDCGIGCGGSLQGAAQRQGARGLCRPVPGESYAIGRVLRVLVRGGRPDLARFDHRQGEFHPPDQRTRLHVNRRSAGSGRVGGARLGIGGGNADSGPQPNRLVEWDLLVALQYGRGTIPDESGRDLVPARCSAKMLHPAGRRHPAAG